MANKSFFYLICYFFVSEFLKQTERARDLCLLSYIMYSKIYDVPILRKRFVLSYIKFVGRLLNLTLQLKFLFKLHRFYNIPVLSKKKSRAFPLQALFLRTNIFMIHIF